MTLFRAAEEFPLALTGRARLSLEAGEHEAALTLSGEALGAVGSQPTPERARVLTVHALAQTACGQLDDALVTSAEAVALWRRATAAEPGTHVRDFGRALDDHANRLRNAGRHDEAVAFAAEGPACHGSGCTVR